MELSLQSHINSFTPAAARERNFLKPMQSQELDETGVTHVQLNKSPTLSKVVNSMNFEHNHMFTYPKQKAYLHTGTSAHKTQSFPTVVKTVEYA